MNTKEVRITIKLQSNYLYFNLYLYQPFVRISQKNSMLLISMDLRFVIFMTKI
jgi:hypothetical protein